MPNSTVEISLLDRALASPYARKRMTDFAQDAALLRANVRLAGLRPSQARVHQGRVLLGHRGAMAVRSPVPESI